MKFLLFLFWFKFNSNRVFINSRPKFFKLHGWFWTFAWWIKIRLERACLSWNSKINILYSLCSQSDTSHDFTVPQVDDSLWHEWESLLWFFALVCVQVVNEVRALSRVLEERDSWFTLSGNVDYFGVLVIEWEGYSCVIIKSLLYQWSA